MVFLAQLSVAALALATVDGTLAHAVHRREPQPTPASLVARQQSATGAFSDFSGSLAPSISSIIATITSGTPSVVPTVTAKTTYTAGAINPSITNAPPLPDAASVLVANFPPLDVSPDPNFGIGQQILASVDLSDIPNIPITNGTCTGTSATNAQQNHWWTCGGWTASTDVTVCPDKDTWGLSYDDGPSPYSVDLLSYLDAHSLKSTFFIVGSRAISRPDILRYEYMNGHQLSVHTWSHPQLTTLTNEQIVLELGWTKEVIRQITGVTPNTMRPPYGDIDDRVRAICAKMNLTPIIWTSVSQFESYDTGDWQIGAGVVSAAESVSRFESILKNSSSLNTGYIVLEHDLYAQSVELATEVVLPAALAMSPKQSLMPIVECLKLPLGDAYIESNSNTTGSGGAGSFSSSSSAAGSTSTSSSGINSSGNLGSGSGSSSGGSSSSSSSSSGSSGAASLKQSSLSLTPLVLGLAAMIMFSQM